MIKKGLFLLILILIVIASFFVGYSVNKSKPINETENFNLSSWVVEKIAQEESNSRYSGPLKKCNYQNKTVFYFISECCDHYDYLFDENGQKICAPTGGLTGRGDGKCLDFSQENCEIIWVREK